MREVLWATIGLAGAAIMTACAVLYANELGLWRIVLWVSAGVFGLTATGLISHFIHERSKRACKPSPIERSLEYLDHKDSALGPAIISMALYSAWGRWYAAQYLANSRTAIGERHLYQTAASVVMDKILDGELEVSGRRPGKMEYEGIPRTHWRSSAFYAVEDPMALCDVAPKFHPVAARVWRLLA
jgi:hypothetical protein